MVNIFCAIKRLMHRNKDFKIAVKQKGCRTNTTYFIIRVPNSDTKTIYQVDKIINELKESMSYHII